MRTLTRLLTIGLALGWGGLNVARAQDAPPPATPTTPAQPANTIESLQTKGALTDDDNAALRNWIGQRIQALSATDAKTSNEAFADLRGAKKGTPVFVQAYVAACIQAVGGAYEPAEGQAAARMIALLNTLNEIDTFSVLVKALGDQRVPVRAAAAIGLRLLQPKIAGAGGNVPGEALAALRDAGKKEESSVVLRLIYDALNFERLPDMKALAEAVVAVLSARGDQYGGGEVKAAGADRAGLLLANRLAAQLDDDGRKRAAIASARMLQYGVWYYTTELHQIDDKSSSQVQLQIRDRIELFIEAAETLLRTAARPQESPDVTKAMQESITAEKSINMKLEMNKWANLVQPQYQVDVHVETAETESEEAPAEEP